MPEHSKYMEVFANTRKENVSQSVDTLLVLPDMIDNLIYMDELCYMEILVISNLQRLLQCCQ